MATGKFGLLQVHGFSRLIVPPNPSLIFQRHDKEEDEGDSPGLSLEWGNYDCVDRRFDDHGFCPREGWFHV